jgi:hypothetical protein
MGALNSGGGTVSYFDWGTATCKKRYRVRWENNNELAADVNYGAAGTTAGVFAAGTCDDTSFDGCKDTGSGKTLFEMEKAEDQYMIGELFISGNVGTLMQKNHFSNNFQNATKDGVISCGGTRIEKLTMTQSSASAATIAVDNSFVADSTNAAECATNEFFSHNASEESSMVLKLQK